MDAALAVGKQPAAVTGADVTEFAITWADARRAPLSGRDQMRYVLGALTWAMGVTLLAGHLLQATLGVPVRWDYMFTPLLLTVLCFVLPRWRTLTRLQFNRRYWLLLLLLTVAVVLAGAALPDNILLRVPLPVSAMLFLAGLPWILDYQRKLRTTTRTSGPAPKQDRRTPSRRRS